MKKDFIRSKKYTQVAVISTLSSVSAIILAFNVMADRTNNQCHSRPLQFVVWAIVPAVVVLGLMQLLNVILNKRYRLLWIAIPLVVIASLASVVALFFSVFCYQF